MNYKKLTIIASIITIFLVFWLLYLILKFNFSLEEIQGVFTIIGSFSIGLVLITYINNNRQSEIMATIDQISFFREKIIVGWDEFQIFILKNINSKFIFSRISLEKPEFIFIKKEYEVNFNRQISIILDTQKEYPNVFFNSDIIGKHVFLLNLIEEFALRVLSLKTSGNQILESVKNAFIQIVEYNAVALLFIRDVRDYNKSYAGILELYNIWKKDVKDNMFIIKSLEKNQLITKKQREEFYKNRKEKFGY